MKIFKTIFSFMRSSAAILLLLSLLGCNSQDAQREADQAAFKEVQLLCENLSTTTNDGEHIAVYAVLKDSKIKLTEIHSCFSIEPIDYSKYHIPETALFAVGGEGDDHDEYVFAQLNEKDDDELLFYVNRIEKDHSQPTITALASYKKGKFQVLRPLHVADISGYYMYEGQDSSYVLFLGVKGPKLTTKLFSTVDPMPAQKMLQRALAEFESLPYTDFNCELNTLVFESDLGNGTVFWRPDSAAIIFNRFIIENKRATFQLIGF